MHQITAKCQAQTCPFRLPADGAELPKSSDALSRRSLGNRLPFSMSHSNRSHLLATRGSSQTRHTAPATCAATAGFATPSALPSQHTPHRSASHFVVRINALPDAFRKADTSGGPAGTSRVRTHSQTGKPAKRGNIGPSFKPFWSTLPTGRGHYTSPTASAHAHNGRPYPGPPHDGVESWFPPGVSVPLSPMPVRVAKPLNWTEHGLRAMERACESALPSTHSARPLSRFDGPPRSLSDITETTEYPCKGGNR